MRRCLTVTRTPAPFCITVRSPLIGILSWHFNYHAGDKQICQRCSNVFLYACLVEPLLRDLQWSSRDLYDDLLVLLLPAEHGPIQLHVVSTQLSCDATSIFLLYLKPGYKTPFYCHPDHRLDGSSSPVLTAIQKKCRL